jgi:SAM-dependent methyltransferase
MGGLMLAPMPEVRVTDRDDNEFVLDTIVCPVCGPSIERTIGLRGGAHHWHGRGVETRIVECTRCGLLYANPYPTPTDFQRLYADPEKYFESHDLEGRTRKFRRVAQQILAKCQKPSPSLLDVGSGRGEMLVAARDVGFGEVLGLEPSIANREFAAEHGVELIPKMIEEFADETDRTFDAVTLNAILEHVPDPDSMIEACARLVPPGGVLYVDVPNEANLLAMVGNSLNRLRGSQTVLQLSPTFPPYHVFGFTQRSIRFLLEKHGFEILSLRVAAWLRVRSDGSLKGRARAFAAMSIQPIANLTSTAHNMFIFARRPGRPLGTIQPR